MCQHLQTISTLHYHRAFEAWLLAQGGLDLGKDTPLALALHPEHDRSITLETTRSIEQDQIVVAVPESLLLTTALPPPLAAAAATAGLDALGRLALRLLAEAAAGEGSTWLPYLRVLPRRESMHLPILWDDGDEEEEESGLPPLLPLLGPSPLHNDVLECRATMRQELAALREALSADSGGSSDEYDLSSLLGLLEWGRWTWARAVAMSRPYILVSAD